MNHTSLRCQGNTVFLLLVPVFQRCADKGCEQLLRLIRTGLEFRMELHADEPRVIRQGNDLYQALVRRQSCDLQALFGELLAEIVVEFETVAVVPPMFSMSF